MLTVGTLAPNRPSLVSTAAKGMTMIDGAHATETVENPFTGHDTGTLLELRKNLMGVQDDLRAQTSAVSAEAREIDFELMRRMDRDSVTSMKGDGITVSIREHETVKIDRDTPFADIARQLLEMGHGECLRAQLSVAKVQELDAEGTRLPAGVSIESFRKIHPLRTAKRAAGRNATIEPVEEGGGE